MGEHDPWMSPAKVSKVEWALVVALVIVGIAGAIHGLLS